MSTILPSGESLRKAVKWISEKREEPGGPPLYRIIEEACMKFNLSPTDHAFLERFFQKKPEDS
jgi:hypothetical protein